MATLAMVRFDLMRVLWRWRSLVILAYFAAPSWLNAGDTSWLTDSNGPRRVVPAITDAVPLYLPSIWSQYPVQGVVLVLLACAVVIEERSSGANWTLIHRSGGIRRWWTAKLVSAFFLTVITVSALSIVLIVCATLRGWQWTLQPTDYSQTKIARLIYEPGLSPLLTCGLTVGLQIAVFTPVALLAMVIAARVQRPFVAYALPIAALVIHWRVISPKIPTGLGYRFDPFRQTSWLHHGEAMAYTWWYTAITLPCWALAAYLFSKAIMRRTEIATRN